MPGAVIATSAAKERAHLYHDRLTGRAFMYSGFIAQAGFLFGYDLDKPLLLLVTHLTKLLQKVSARGMRSWSIIVHHSDSLVW